MTIKERVLKVLNERSLSQNALAKGLGISSAMLSQYLSGQYPGNTESLETKLEQWLTKEDEKRNKRPKTIIPFVETSISKKIFEIARLCHIDDEIGVIYGDAGIGKTQAVQEYAKRNSDVILIEADLGYTAKVLFSELHQRLGFSGHGTLHNMFEDCRKQLNNTGRLIIIDEAEQLPYRALELLRRLNDKAGVGILLVGMPRLMSNLRGNRGEYAQLFSRIGYHAKLSLLTSADTSKIAAQCFSDIKPHLK